MYRLLVEGSAIGIITLILGKISENLIKRNNKNKIKRFSIQQKDIVFFVTGFLLHLVIEYMGINKWYCDKKFISGIKRFN